MTFWERKNKEITAPENLAKESHKWRYFFLGLFLLAVGAGATVYYFAQKPKQGVINTPQTENLADKNSTIVPETFSGKYVSFLYDQNYVLKAHEVSSDPQVVILETAFLAEPTAISKKIALTIRSLPSHNLADVPDYKMRDNNPKLYQKENFSLGNVNGISFIPADDSQFTKAFFILHDERLAIIAFTAPALKDVTLEQEANTLAKSLTWLK